jgi:RimJ/RimL family protein N-acetyltransferase
MRSFLNMITIRNINSSDLKELMEWRMDSQVQKSSISEVELTMEGQVAWFNNCDIESYFIVEVNRDKIGTFNLKGSYPHSRYVWAFHLNPNFRGKEYKGIKYSIILCTKALETAFNKLDANKIVGQVLADNKRSVKLHKRLGFKEEGYLKQDVYKNGKYIDLYQFALLKEEYINEHQKSE